MVCAVGQMVGRARAPALVTAVPPVGSVAHPRTIAAVDASSCTEHVTKTPDPPVLMVCVAEMMGTPARARYLAIAARLVDTVALIQLTVATAASRRSVCATEHGIRGRENMARVSGELLSLRPRLYVAL